MARPGAVAVGNLEATGAASPSRLSIALCVLLVATATVFYWPTVASILARWSSDPTYSHGWLVLAVSAWMTWRAWRAGQFGPLQPAFYALVPLVGAGAVWLLARSASINVVQQLTLPAILLGGIWVLYGWRGFRVLLVPIGVLYFVLPVWDYLRPVLQALTVDVTGVMLDWLGVAAYIEGHRVNLAVGSFIVVEGCSGLHFFMAAGALATIQAHLYIRRRWAQAVLIGAALSIALVANWIRVVAVIYAGHATEMQSFLIRDHYYFGWVVFMLLMIPVLYLGRRLETDARTQQSVGPAPVEPGAVASGLVAAVAGVALAPLAWWATTTIAGPAVNEPYLPAEVGRWTRMGEASPDWRPVQPGSDLQLGGHYSDGEHALDAWIIYYRRQGSGRELVGYGRAMARPGDGRLVRGDGEPGEWQLWSRWGGVRLIRYRYEMAGRVTTSEGRARLYQSLGNLGGDPEAYALVVSARCRDETCAGARALLQDFELALGPGLPVASGATMRDSMSGGEGE